MRQTLVLVCVPQVGSTTVAMYFLCTVCLLSSGSAHSSGCVVNGYVSVLSIIIIIIIISPETEEG